MKDLTIIVPIHVFDNNVETLLNGLFSTIQEGTNIILSCASNIVDDIKKIYSKDFKYVSSDDSSFANLVNTAVDSVETKWFSIAEFDDEYTPIWFKNFDKYKEHFADVSIFVPLTDLIDFDDKKFIGYGNEAVWASSFSNELGYIDHDCLQNFFDFYMTGSVFNTEDWKECGGLKKSIKLTFWYEFLLRMTHNGKKIYVIPRVGYTHKLNRDNSLIKIYTETIDESESQGWINIAKQEFYFKNDRGKTFKKEED